MTRAEQVYADTLNLLGSDTQSDEVPGIRQALDDEHASADQRFARVLAKRRTMITLSTI